MMVTQITMTVVVLYVKFNLAIHVFFLANYALQFVEIQF